MKRKKNKKDNEIQTAGNKDVVNINIADLLMLEADCSEIEMQDLIRGIVPATETNFSGGILILNEAGLEHLCIAIQNGIVRGNTVMASEILHDIQHPEPELDYSLTVDAACRICIEVIEGRAEGNPEKAKQILAYLKSVEDRTSQL